MVLCKVAFDDEGLNQKLERMSILIDEINKLAFSLRCSYGLVIESEEPEADQISR